MMGEVFEHPPAALSDEYLHRLLVRDDVIALVALDDGVPVGGLTAYVLPLTRSAVSEIFLYDIAVRADHQRQGIGAQMMTWLRAKGRVLGTENVFVPADNEDTHALDFYRALGGIAAPVTIFTFDAAE